MHQNNKIHKIHFINLLLLSFIDDILKKMFKCYIIVIQILSVLAGGGESLK